MAIVPIHEDDIPSGQLADWSDNVPAEIRELADKYDKAHTAKSTALGKLNTAKDVLIEAMVDEGCQRCPIRNGDKFVRLSSNNVVTIENPKKDEFDGDN